MTHPDLIERITRSLAYMLRHQPEQFDLEVDEYGWADIHEVVRALNERLGEEVSAEDVADAVTAGDRQRYEIETDRIRALYGHSIEVKPGEPGRPPEHLYLGLSRRDADRADRHGLRPGRRRFLHLALSREDALESAQRSYEDCVLMEIQALDAWEDGINFYDRRSLFLSDPIPPHHLVRLEAPRSMSAGHEHEHDTEDGDAQAEPSFHEEEALDAPPAEGEEASSEGREEGGGGRRGRRGRRGRGRGRGSDDRGPREERFAAPQSPREERPAMRDAREDRPARPSFREERPVSREERPARPSFREERPAAREERRDRAPREERPAYRDERPARPSFREDRPQREERPAYREDRPQREERPAYREERSAPRGERPSFREERPAARERAPAREERPQREERPAYREDRPQREERPAYREERRDRPARDERPAFREERRERPAREERRDRPAPARSAARSEESSDSFGLGLDDAAQVRREPARPAPAPQRAAPPPAPPRRAEPEEDNFGAGI